MKWGRVAKKAGKALFFAACGVAGAVSVSTILAAWTMVKPGRSRNYDSVPRIRRGKLEPLTLETSDGLQLHAWVQLCPKATSNNWVLVLAGDSEKVLKPEEVESLYKCIPETKRLVFFPGAGHEDLLVYDPRRYIKAVGSFLRECTGSRQRVAGKNKCKHLIQCW